MNSSVLITRCVVPSRHGVLSFSSTWPAALSCTAGAELLRRQDDARVIERAIRRGLVFFNPPDMDCGLGDAAFVPLFGQPASTLLAFSRLAKSLNMSMQHVAAQILPDGLGWVLRFESPWKDWPTPTLP